MIKLIRENKKDYLELLLLGDEAEHMIDGYLERGDLFVWTEEETKAVCVVTNEGDGVCELKNMAVARPYWRKGYGKSLLTFIVDYYKGIYDKMLVGTGESPLTLPFYKACGFEESHRVANFFIEHYEHPIYEEGVQLVDMIYLSKKL